MSAIKMILHASRICADTERDIDSVFDAIISEVGEFAEEKRIANGKSYKQAGPDGMDGEIIDVLAATVDMIDRLHVDPTEAFIEAKLKPKLLKWLEKTGTVIPDDDEYFGDSTSTFHGLEKSFAELGYDLTKYPNEYRIYKCGHCGYFMALTLDEVKLTLKVAQTFGL